MATVAANPPPSSHGTKIDINQLSQTELQVLAFSSDSYFDVLRSDDIVSPQIDRSIFNESAGTRQQTFSRTHQRSHSRFPGLHPSIKPHRNFHASSDPVTHSIVHFLKHFVNGNHNPPPPPLLPEAPAPEPTLEPVTVTELGFQNLQEDDVENPKPVSKSRLSVRKRIFEDGVELQKVNAKGEVVDFVRLGEKGDELYEEELRRMTEGLETEESVLGFLGALDGEWCSRRKRRKYVDAVMLGDVLPIAWKILLGLRRRGYRVSVYCRRYISPSGQFFLSCREVASFLTSYFGGIDADEQMDENTCGVQQVHVMSSPAMDGCSAAKADSRSLVVALAASARSPITASGNDDLTGIGKLPEVKVQDIFECSKCNLTFTNKNLYLTHLVSSHQKSSKRGRRGTSIGHGVIIKDGKFECQFCHKAFDEKRSYSSHVGIHVRNSKRNLNELPPPTLGNKSLESPRQDALSSKSLQIDVPVEAVQSSIAGTLEIGTGEQPFANESAETLSLEKHQATLTDREANMVSVPVEIQPEDLNSGRVPNDDLNHSEVDLNADRVSNDDLNRSDATFSDEANLVSDPLEIQVDARNADRVSNDDLNHSGDTYSDDEANLVSDAKIQADDINADRVPNDDLNHRQASYNDHEANLVSESIEVQVEDLNAGRVQNDYLNHRQASYNDPEANLVSDSIEVQVEDLNTGRVQNDYLNHRQAICSDEANLVSDPMETQVEDLNANKVLNEDLNHSSQAIPDNDNMVNNGYKWNIDVNMEANCLTGSEHVVASDIGSYGNINLEMGLMNNDVASNISPYGNINLEMGLMNNHVASDIGPYGNINPEMGLMNNNHLVFPDRVSSVALAEPFQFFPSFNSTPNKVQHEYSIMDQKLDNVTGFGELRFDDMDSFKYGFVNPQGFSAMQGCSVNMGHDSGIDGFNSSVRFHSEEVMLNTMASNQLTVCVWCRTEFRLEGIDAQTSSDSIGYMCPTCKAKISGHYVGGLSLNPHGF